MRSGDAYEAMLNAGESTGGLRNAWGNMAVLDGRSGYKFSWMLLSFNTLCPRHRETAEI